MAKAASKRPLRKPIKMHGPVGEHKQVHCGDTFERSRLDSGEIACCEDCGYHVCSCKRHEVFSFPLNAEMPSVLVKVMSSPYVRRGDAALVELEESVRHDGYTHVLACHPSDVVQVKRQLVKRRTALADHEIARQRAVQGLE
jgi:hypothetical protein